MLALLAITSGAVAQLPGTLALTLAESRATLLNALVWAGMGALWITLAWRQGGSTAGLWNLPSSIFRATLALGTAAILLGRVTALLAETGPRPELLASALEAVLYQLGVVALSSLAAFALARSLVRPVLLGTSPPLGARDISVRTRYVVATAGASFATAGILLDVVIDFDTTPGPLLFGFLTTAAVLVTFSAAIGWLVGDDAARALDAVTHRMLELAHADRAARVRMPVVTADELADLTLAAAELEQRIRRDEAAAATTAERERIARELHDGVAKSVSALSLEAASLAAHAPEELRQRLSRIEHLAGLLAEELRAIVHDFRTPAGAGAFGEALRRTAAAHPNATLEIEGDIDRIGMLARFEVLRILEEAVRNVERHAAATHVTARVAVDDGRLRLIVEDDGKGIGPLSWSELAATGHFGLVGMRERAHLLDGEVRVERRPGGGTRVALEVPLDAVGS